MASRHLLTFFVSYLAVSALAKHSDLIAGWTPSAQIQHLCTGGADQQVPPSITLAAASAWGVEAIVIDGLDHSSGIATCLKIALGNLTAQVFPPFVGAEAEEYISASPPIVEFDLTPPLMSWSRVDIATRFLLAVIGVWTLSTLSSRYRRRDRVQCASIEPGGGRRRNWSVYFLSTLLARPVACALLGAAAVAVPTSFQLIASAQSVLSGGELFDLEITSLRAVTGTLTDRQDAYALLSQPNSLQLSALTRSPPPPSPSPPPPAASPPPSPSPPPPEHRQRTRRLFGDEGHSRASGSARRLQQTRTINIFYSRLGGRKHEAVVGNVLSPSALDEIRSQGKMMCNG